MKRFAKLFVLFILSAVLLTAPLSALAGEGDQMTGKEIMKKVKERETWEDRKSTLKNVLINSQGNKRIREIKQLERDFGNVDKRILIFTYPRDVEGTAFMSWSYEDKAEDDQWLYLPALGRIRRIAGSDKTDRFMGSDFTYEDLGQRDLDEDTHTLLREEKVNGEDCYVVENVPKEEGYMYSKTITWVAKGKWIGLKKEFYDPKGDLWKVLTVDEYQEIEDILTITKTEMKDLKEEHRTVIEFSNVEYNTGIRERMFTKRTMERGF